MPSAVNRQGIVREFHIVWRVITLSIALHRVLHCVPKKQIHIILNILYSFKSVAMKFSIDIIQKPKHDIDELKQRLIDTWDGIPRCFIDEATD